MGALTLFLGLLVPFVTGISLRSSNQSLRDVLKYTLEQTLHDHFISSQIGPSSLPARKPFLQCLDTPPRRTTRFQEVDFLGVIEKHRE